MSTMIQGLEEIYAQVLNKQIPDSFPRSEYHFEYNPERSLSEFQFRDKFINSFGFVRVSKDWILPLANYLRGKKVMEIMAGAGVISKALQDEGVDIIASDDYSWSGTNWFNEHAWTDVENIDAVKAIKKYGKNVDYIICSWPYMSNVAYKCLLMMRKVNPSCQMIYIGEGYGGCTADDDFHESIEEVNDVLFENATENFTRWDGLHDYPTLVK